MSDRAVPPPRLTVVTTAFGELAFLAQTVESILRQDYRDFEFIIVDDASGRADLFDDLARRDGRIRIIHNDVNLGPAGAANRAIAHAAGEIIARIDADDIAEPGRLGRLVAAFDADPQLGLVGSWFVRTDSEGRELETVRTPCRDVELRWQMLFHNPFCHSSVAYRKSVFDNAGGYNEAMRASLDADLWYRMAPLCRMGCVPEVLARLRMHPRSITAANPPDWRRRTEHHRRRLWDACGIDYVAEIIPDLVQFISGWGVSRTEKRPQVYRTALDLAHAFAGRPLACDEDRAALRRLTSDLVVRALADTTLDRRTWAALCGCGWRIDRAATLRAIGARLRVSKPRLGGSGAVSAIRRRLQSFSKPGAT